MDSATNIGFWELSIIMVVIASCVAASEVIIMNAV